MKAIWKNTVLAESEDTIVVEGNHYFPPHRVRNISYKDGSIDSQLFWIAVSSSIR